MGPMEWKLSMTATGGSRVYDDRTYALWSARQVILFHSFDMYLYLCARSFRHLRRHDADTKVDTSPSRLKCDAKLNLSHKQKKGIRGSTFLKHRCRRAGGDIRCQFTSALARSFSYCCINLYSSADGGKLNGVDEKRVLSRYSNRKGKKRKPK